MGGEIVAQLDKNAMIAVARHARTVTRIAGGVLVLLFGWLKLNNEAVGQALSGSSPEFLLRVSLALYYLAWVMGATNDTNEQELAYAVPPSNAIFPKGGYLAAVSLVSVFGSLCWVRSPRAFSVVLAVFLMANIAWWRYMVERVLPRPLTVSAERFRAEKDYVALAILESFRSYIAGSWQWWRFASGAVMVIIILVVAFLGLPASLTRIAFFADGDRVLGILLLTYVVGFEAWIWIMRHRVTTTRLTLTRLGERYSLVLRSDLENEQAASAS